MSGSLKLRVAVFCDDLALAYVAQAVAAINTKERLIAIDRAAVWQRRGNELRDRKSTKHDQILHETQFVARAREHFATVQERHRALLDGISVMP